MSPTFDQNHELVQNFTLCSYGQWLIELITGLSHIVRISHFGIRRVFGRYAPKTTIINRIRHYFIKSQRDNIFILEKCSGCSLSNTNAFSTNCIIEYNHVIIHRLTVKDWPEYHRSSLVIVDNEHNASNCVMISIETFECLTFTTTHKIYHVSQLLLVLNPPRSWTITNNNS